MSSIVTLITNNREVLYMLVVWDMIWKGFAMWKAARNESKTWFVVLMIANTLGILPISYLILEKWKSNH